MKIKTAILIAALGAATLGLGACETATPYQPLARSNATSGGFTDQKLDEGHYKVTFSGNTLTARETVETYLLYRSAELTVQSSFDWFEMVDRHTDRDRRTYTDPDPFYGPGYRYGYWRPYWRYYGHGFGWRTWDPFWGDPFWGETTTTVERFAAEAEIIMHHGPRPEGSHGYDAHQVMDNLGPKIQRPEAPK